ncbi:hypothetical protein [Actinokineospora fastidiosa]|uniref:DUF4226 domain-containing protein n=1 Tax=Actinokineospora fastidiosa TaxID=1816 RepID=A0A918LBD1_9PSEU|nr:hypothetical protein [Actinokineospora fastidiosa]GGS26025.1 hypothetical protein GCM10010171_19280 [Actinokineospora fastidiosa]
MAVYGQIRDWRPEPLDDAEQVLRTRGDLLAGLADDLATAARPERWTGAAADAAAELRHRLTDDLDVVVIAVQAVRRALMAAADEVIGLRHVVGEAEELARRHRFTIDEAGAVADLPPFAPDPGRARVRAELEDRVRLILRRADEIDTALADVLVKVVRGEAAAVAAPTIPGPPPPPPADPGAGPHGVDPWWTTVDDHATHTLASRAAELADAVGLTNAAAHLNHYLGNSGAPLTVDPDHMLRDVPTFQATVDSATAAEVNRIAADAAANGTYGRPVQFSTGWQGHYIQASDNKDWFYAMGGVQYAVTGVATVQPPATPGGQPIVQMDYQVHVFDRYNWDGGKSTEIGPITVEDSDMAEMHRAGVAQEYDISGSSDPRTYTGEVPGPHQLPEPPESRDGTREDPGRGPR